MCFGIVMFVLLCSFSLLSSIPEVLPFHNPFYVQYCIEYYGDTIQSTLFTIMKVDDRK